MLIKEVYNKVVLCLRNNNKENISFEAKQIVHSVLHTKDTDLIQNTKQVSDEQEKIILDRCNKRCENYPLQYILGEWEFFGLPFFVGEGVLIPRQDTETLCEVIIDEHLKKDELKIIDLCSGSGCIAIALEKHSHDNCNVFALEKSKEAIAYLKENIKLNNSRVTLIEDDVLNPKTEETDFDIVVCNPPYLTEADMQNLQEELKYEPSMALYGEKNGLYFYENITKIWSSKIKSGGVLAYEIGIHQQDAVIDLMIKHGFKDITKIKDLNSVIRVIAGIKQ